MREEERVRAFESIFAREFDYVCHNARRLGVPSKDIEDLAHDVFVTVYRKLPDYDEQRPFRPWLFAIVFRTAVAHLRRARNRVELMDDRSESIADESAQADELLETEQTHDRVRRAFERLNPDKRGILLMHDVEGCTVPVIAEALGIPLNTAYTRLRAARLELRKILVALQDSEETP